MQIVSLIGIALSVATIIWGDVRLVSVAVLILFIFLFIGK